MFFSGWFYLAFFGLTCVVCPRFSLLVSFFGITVADFSLNIACCDAFGCLMSQKHKQGPVLRSELYAT